LPTVGSSRANLIVQPKSNNQLPLQRGIDTVRPDASIQVDGYKESQRLGDLIICKKETSAYRDGIGVELITRDQVPKTKKLNPRVVFDVVKVSKDVQQRSVMLVKPLVTACLADLSTAALDWWPEVRKYCTIFGIAIAMRDVYDCDPSEISVGTLNENRIFFDDDHRVRVAYWSTGGAWSPESDNVRQFPTIVKRIFSSDHKIMSVINAGVGMSLTFGQLFTELMKLDFIEDEEIRFEIRHYVSWVERNNWVEKVREMKTCVEEMYSAVSDLADEMENMLKPTEADRDFSD
jgi:hypothetical protein